ncbi:MAG TPA: amidohydrolase family protein [Acidimicrobiia bacterium]|nr:amidohydrolase family protein [Acidimicrobiia bacterium]
MAAEPVDTLIEGSHVVTMNAHRDVVLDGAVAVRGSEIVAVGKRDDLTARFDATDRVGGPRFVVTPGMVNAHLHITGEPLTRGYVPDDTPFEENVFQWLVPLYSVYTEDDERLSAQLAAAELLKSGCTSFVEAGTVRFVDAVVDGLVEIGIRARVGKWVWDLPPEPEVYRQTTAEAIENLERTLQAHRSVAGGRIQAWSMVIGHTTCSDELWRAAKAAADRWETGLNFHMSPAAMDPDGFLAQFGHRPIEHLAELGVLGPNVVIVHCVHVDDNEIELMAHHQCSVAHCPTTALKVSYGITQIGKMPEMHAAGVNLAIGTDGNNAANSSDMMRATYLVAGLFKDARRDPSMFPAEVAYEMATLGGARAMLSDHEIGSIEAGKKADLVLHDRERPEWSPLLNVANQLVWSADGRGVHTVFVDGRKVVDAYRLTTLDERALYQRAQVAGEAIVARSGLPDRAKWPKR